MGFNVAIDGPAGAGKSTIAKIVAQEMNFIYVDTGAMYRAIALYLIRKGVGIEETDRFADECQGAEVSIQYVDGVQQVILNGENVSGWIRTEEVGNMASASSVDPAVRNKLLDLQRNLAAENDVVMDGRDIGTNILPNADVKVYLTASVEERAMRRFKELMAKGMDLSQSGSAVPVYSAGSGRVVGLVKSPNHWSCGGQVVFISHNIKGKYYTTIYMHLRKILVQNGQIVDKNTVIGYMGGNPSIETYDRCTNGQHLHFGISEGMFTTWAKAKASQFNPATMVNFPKVGTRFKDRITQY